MHAVVLLEHRLHVANPRLHELYRLGVRSDQVKPAVGAPNLFALGQHVLLCIFGFLKDRQRIPKEDDIHIALEHAEALLDQPQDPQRSLDDKAPECLGADPHVGR
eukprot:6609019-Prymnesium_polylepis.2